MWHVVRQDHSFLFISPFHPEVLQIAFAFADEVFPAPLPRREAISRKFATYP
jgi:hypothetical protein